MSDYPFHGYESRNLDRKDVYSAIKHENELKKQQKRVKDVLMKGDNSIVNRIIDTTPMIWFIVGIPSTVLAIIYLVS